MPSLTETADFDRGWFHDHPGRHYRARTAAPAEREAFGDDPNLIVLIEHLGRGVLLHQPVILSGTPPADEGTVALLFALAVSDPLAIPTLELPLAGYVDLVSSE